MGYYSILLWFKVESRGFSRHAFIGFLMGLFIPLWWSTGNSFKSLGKAFVTLMVTKPKRTYVLLILDLYKLPVFSTRERVVEISCS